jgi:glycosyltransferase involved in cell wall biosynthesis
MNILSLSIIIATKNRSSLLAKNLSSLHGQCRGGDEVIVIDASDDDTPSVVTSFESSLPIRYVRFTKPGFPLFFNEGANVAQNPVLVFFSDDCTASPTFLERIRNAQQRRTHAVIQGLTHSRPKGNLYADIMADHYKNWLTMMSLPHGELKSFDCKNVSMPRSLFWKHHGFRRRMSQGSEDVEFGMRLRRSGIHIYLDRSIVAYHRERTNFGELLSQHRRFAESEGYLDRILPKEERLGIIPPQKLLLHLVSFLRREYLYLRRGSWQKAALLPFVYAALAWIRVTGYATNRWGKP